MQDTYFYGLTDGQQVEFIRSLPAADIIPTLHRHCVPPLSKRDLLFCFTAARVTTWTVEVTEPDLVNARSPVPEEVSEEIYKHLERESLALFAERFGAVPHLHGLGSLDPQSLYKEYVRWLRRTLGAETEKREGERFQLWWALSYAACGHRFQFGQLRADLARGWRMSLYDLRNSKKGLMLQPGVKEAVERDKAVLLPELRVWMLGDPERTLFFKGRHGEVRIGPRQVKQALRESETFESESVEPRDSLDRAVDDSGDRLLRDLLPDSKATEKLKKLERLELLQLVQEIREERERQGFGGRSGSIARQELLKQPEDRLSPSELSALHGISRRSLRKARKREKEAVLRHPAIRQRWE